MAFNNVIGIVMEMVNKLGKPIKSASKDIDLMDKSIDTLDKTSSDFSKSFGYRMGHLMGRTRRFVRESVRGHGLVERAKKRLGQIAERVDDELDTGFGRMIKRFGPLAAGVGTIVAMGKAGIASEKSITQLRKSIRLSAEDQSRWAGLIHQTMIEFGDTREEADAYFAVAAKAKIRGKDLEYFTRAAAKMTDVTTLGAEAVGLLFERIADLYDLGYENLEKFGSAFKYITETTKLTDDALNDVLMSSEELILRIPKELRSKFIPAWMAASGALANLHVDVGGVRDVLTSMFDQSNDQAQTLAGLLSGKLSVSYDELINKIKRGELTDVFAALSEVIKDVGIENISKQTSELGDLFAGMSFSELEKLSELDAKAMDNITKSTKKAFDEGQRLTEAWKEVENTVGELWNRIKAMGAGFLATFGTPVIEVLSTIVGDFLYPILKTVSNLFNMLPTGLKKVIGLLGGAAIILKTISILGGVISVAFSPISIPLVAITAAITGIILLVKNWKKIVDWLWKGVKSFGSGVIKIFKWIGNAIQDVWGWLKKWIPGFKLIDAAVRGLIDVVKILWDAIVKGVGSAFEGIKGFFMDMWDWVSGFFTSLGETISGFFSSIWNGIKNAFIDVINWAIKKINKLISITPDILLPEAIEGGIPLIPTAQEGAYVKGSRAGTPVIVGERNTPEIIVPLEKIENTRPMVAKGNDDVVEAIQWLGTFLVKNWKQESRRAAYLATDPDSALAEGSML